MNWQKDVNEVNKSGIFTLEIFNGKKDPDEYWAEERISSSEWVCIIEDESNDEDCFRPEHFVVDVGVLWINAEGFE